MRVSATARRGENFRANRLGNSGHQAAPGMRVWRRLRLLAIAGAVAAGCSSEPAPVDSADLLLMNGHVYRVDPERTWAEAVAVKDGRILWTGGNEESVNWAGDETRIVDLGGGMLLPGFQDSHVHPVHSGVTYRQCALFDIVGVDALLREVEACIGRTPDGWIQGGGWSVDNFAPSGLPDKALLDALNEERPIALKSSDGHSLWVNSAALAAAGIDNTTADPPGGRIDRYPGTQTPSGSLQEDSAMNLVFDAAPPLRAEDLEAGLEYARDHLLSLGIVAVQDALAKLAPGDAYHGLDAYRALDERGELNLRVVASLYWENQAELEPQLAAFKAARERYTRGNLAATTVKIWQDGVLETRTAALLEPYVDRDGGFRGDLLNDPERLDAAVSALDAEGFQIHIHAIGDRAIRTSLDALEAARAANGPRDSRHHISHIQLFDPMDIPRFAALDVTANFQPLWAISDAYITELTIPRIGSDRARWLYPIGSLQRSGARVAFGSDWYVSSANPLDGIEAAVTRLDPDGDTDSPLGQGEEISLADAIANYTVNSAFLNFLDHDSGSIEAGKRADLIVVDRNLFDIPPEEINEARVTATLFDGQVVFGEL